MGDAFYLTLGIIFWLFIALWPAIWAKKKGYSFLLILLLAWVTSFIVALIVVALLKDKNQTSSSHSDSQAADNVLKNE